MTTFTILTTIAFGISLVLIFKKSNFPKMEKIVRRISLYSLIGIILCVILLIFDLRIKGTYTTSIIGLSFVLSTIILFGLTKKIGIKILSGLFVVPICVLGIWSFFWEMMIFPIYLLTLPFQPPIEKFTIDYNHHVEVRIGGFLACGESLVITESTFGIFNRQKYIGNNSCVTGIYKIETKEFNNEIADFLIYHDGKRDDFENPYEYQAELKNVW